MPTFLPNDRSPHDASLPDYRQHHHAPLRGLRARSQPASPARRQLLGAAALLAAWPSGPAALAAAAEAGRFSVRPQPPSQRLAAGEHVLSDRDGRRALLYLPPGYDPDRPTPFQLMLHGARGDGDRTLAQQREAADANGVALLCPSTRSGTWDAIRGSFAHDFEELDSLLGRCFERCNIDTARFAVAGFSDGASYGISLGLINGDLFSHVIAHSPGFIIADNWHGRPHVFISHGTADEVLPFERCGKVIHERLQAAGYAPRFDVFDGGHVAATALRSAALAWMKATA